MMDMGSRLIHQKEYNPKQKLQEFNRRGQPTHQPKGICKTRAPKKFNRRGQGLPRKFALSAR
jgi:hypothetical protein